MTTVNLVLHLQALVLMLIVLYGNYCISKVSDTVNRWFLMLASLNIVMLAFESLFFFFFLRGYNSVYLGISECIYHLAHYSFLAGFCFFQAGFIKGKREISPVYKPFCVSVCSLSVILLCLCTINEYIFPLGINSEFFDHLYLAGRLGGTLNLFALIIMIIRCHDCLYKQEIVALLTFHVMPITTSIMKLAFPGLQITAVGFCFSMVIINIFAMYNISVWLGQREAQINRDRMRIMLSQIRPHFIYNVLNTIYNLCDIDVEKAKDAIDLFSGYLRKNFRSIEGKEYISIRDELEQVRFYYLLEKMRFSDDLNLVMDIDEVSFKVPQLSVEPLIENAIKHGILKRPEGGTVWLSVKEKEEDYVIIIEDDGVGFDTGSLEELGPDHVGIRNIKERLSYMGASLDIKSEPGIRTVCTIRVPK